MTLAVDVFVLDEDGMMHVLDVPSGCSDLATRIQLRRQTAATEPAGLSGPALSRRRGVLIVAVPPQSVGR
ncbi:hypothetical protein V2E29_26280 [Streptomyces diastatochromogenes]|uniref:hypothetical protein n=1 Tax=Streptomyces diastatochromogenes TaxID=42236 RepID=UPI002F263ECA